MAALMKNSRFVDNSHFSKILQKLNEQRLSSKFCDVILKVCDTSVLVHSNILASASPYFHTFLGQGEDDPRAFSQNTPQVIEIHIEGDGDESSYGEAVQLVVDYMYTGEATVSLDIINHVTEIAKIMSLQKLISFCEWLLSEEKCDEKVLDVPDEKTQDGNETNEEMASNATTLDSEDINSTPVVADALEDEKNISQAVISFHRRKRGRPKKITQIEELDSGKKCLTNKSGSDIEQSDDSSDDENTENKINVVEFSMRSGRKRKLTSKMKELKHSSKSKEDSSTGLGFVGQRDNYKCEFCPYSTDSYHYYQRHNQAHKQDKRKYTCETCGFTSEKAKSMHIHKKEHLYENYHCDLCEYNGETKEDFEIHMKKHDNPLPFFCKYCDQRFRTKTQLNFHYPKHSKLKPFVCKLCDTGFKWKHALKNHMVTHSTTKEHLCDVCGFATAHKSQLKAHKLVHTGETFKCSECSFEATRKQNLKYHMLTHTREKSYQCEVCGQAFSLSKNMKRHMLLHTNERPHKCDQCTFSTTRFDKLKEHLKKQHGHGEDSKRKPSPFSKNAELGISKLHSQTSKIIPSGVPAVMDGTDVMETDVLSTIQTFQIQLDGNKVVGLQGDGNGMLMQTANGGLQPINVSKLEDGTEITYHFVHVETT